MVYEYSAACISERYVKKMQVEESLRDEPSPFMQHLSQHGMVYSPLILSYISYKAVLIGCLILYCASCSVSS